MARAAGPVFALLKAIDYLQVLNLLYQCERHISKLALKDYILSIFPWPISNIAINVGLPMLACVFITEVALRTT